jgi:hypothetical protein
MAKFFSELNDGLKQFIAEQKIFFTATAPDTGRLNLSPKGMDTFRCIDNQTVGYLDLTGSGNETAAHLGQNGRMTLMFCSFSAKPLILRLYGQGRSIRPGQDDWLTYYPFFNAVPGERQIILLRIESLQTSCGFGVPVYELKEERRMLAEWAEKEGAEAVLAYQRKKNIESIDGVPIAAFSDTD